MKEGWDGRSSPKRSIAQQARRKREYPDAAHRNKWCWMLYNKGWSVKAIAEKLGVSPQRVRQRIALHLEANSHLAGRGRAADNDD